MKSRSDEPVVPLIDFHPVSNGEWCPEPATAWQRRAEQRWRAIVEANHRRLGMTRRQFAESACGAAAALWVLNQAGCSSAEAAPRAQYDVQVSMLLDQAQAREKLGGDEFIFDVQTHPADFKPIPTWAGKKPSDHALDYIKQIYVQSDVSVSCMTGWPPVRGLGEENVRSNAMLRELIERLGGPRFLFHANVDPDLAGERDYVARVADAFGKKISAWKTYPHKKPTARLHDRQGLAVLERMRGTGIKIVAAHRGISDNKGYLSAGSPEDVVRAARAFPDMKFLVYHSGFEDPKEENHAYDPKAPEDKLKGVDRLVRAVEDARKAGQPVRNVWAELGTTWYRLAGHEAAAAHVLGKLIKYLGEDRVLFGTDCLNNGIAQGQIVRLRAFTIPPDLGYPALTPAVKRKIFGLNGAAVYGVDPKAVLYKIKDDDVARLKAAYLDDPGSVPLPHPEEYKGPRTRREFFALRARGGH